MTTRNRLLPFGQDSDEPVVLDADGKELAVKKLRDVQFAAGHLATMLGSKDEGAPRSLANNVLSIMEHTVAELSPVLGYDTRLTAEMEERHGAIRRANERIRELEGILGASKPLEGFHEQTKHIAGVIKEWWRTQGFGSGYLPQFSIGEYGVIELTFVLHLEVGGFSSILMPKDPVSSRDRDRQRIADVVGRGYDLIDCGRERYLMRDTDSNKEKLVAVLRERFPSIHIRQFISESDMDNPDVYHIREIRVYIQNVTDLALPAGGGQA